MGTVFDELEREWPTVARGREGREALGRWASSESTLTEFGTLGELVQWMSRPRGAAGRDILAALTRRAEQDPLAARTALQILLPGLKGVCARVRVDGCPEETAAVVVAAAWERLRHYGKGRHPDRVAGNVVLDALKAACRRSGDRAEPRDPCTLAEWADHRSAEEEVLNAGEELLGVINQAVATGLCDRRDAALIIELRVLGTPAEVVAARDGVCTGSVRRRRKVAELRLRDAA